MPDFHSKTTRVVFDFLAPALLLVAAIAIAYPRWRAGIDWRDEGLLAYGSMRVLNGEVPHRDFVSLQPPLSYYTATMIFKWLGTSLASLRILGLSVFLALPLLIYGVARLVMGPILAFGAALPACLLGLPYVYFVPLAVWQGIAVSFAAVLLFLAALFSGRRWIAFPAGILTAISLFLRHDQGVYTTAAMLVLALAVGFTGDRRFSKLKPLLFWWIAGVAIVALPLFMLWWRLGALPEMFRQLVVFPLTTYRKTSALPFPRFAGAKSGFDTAVVTLFYLPGIVQTIALIYLVQSITRRCFGFREATLLFLLVWSALFYLQVMVRSDQSHLLMTLPPLFMLAAYLWSLVLNNMATQRWLRVSSSAILSVVVLMFLWSLRSMALPDLSHATETLGLPRGGVRIQQPEVIATFVNALQGSVPPERSILALPYQPMFYFLCDRRNPTCWNYLWPGDQTTTDHQHLVEQAERDPPAVVLLGREQDLSTYAPTITQYIEDKYVHTGNFGNLAIYLRRPPN